MSGSLVAVIHLFSFLLFFFNKNKELKKNAKREESSRKRKTSVI
jgi:hypothetical protein